MLRKVARLGFFLEQILLLLLVRITTEIATSSQQI